MSVFLKVLMFFGIVILACLFGLLTAWPFMWAWNFAVVSAIDTANQITYWKAYVLMLFISIFIISKQNTSS